jgi:hypothetical protein
VIMSLVEHERLIALSDFIEKYYPEEYGHGNEVEVAIRILKDRRPRPAQAIIDNVKDAIAKIIDHEDSYRHGVGGWEELKEKLLRTVDLMSFNLPKPLWEREHKKNKSSHNK